MMFFKKFSGVILGISIFVIFGVFVFSRDSSREFLITRVEREEKKTFNQIDKIKEGIALLKSSQPLEYEYSDSRLSSLSRKQIALAILDKNTGEIIEKRYWISQSDLNSIRETGIINLKPVDDVHNSIVPSILWWNSFNSVYDFPAQKNLVVVANKYLIDRESLPEQKSLLLSVDGTNLGNFTDMVYSPYSDELHDISVVNEGIKYINDGLESAIEELRRNNVESLAYPGKLISDTLDKELIRNLIITEHVDPTSALLSDDGGLLLAQRVLVIIGANKEWAYRYTGSPAGANGIAQFIEPTYNDMVRLYPSAGLIKNYKLGMADHVNAIKAMALFLDTHTKTLRNGTKEDLKIEQTMLASTYNGGPSRTMRAINKDGENWESSSILREETRNYIKKYKMIRNLKLF